MLDLDTVENTIAHIQGTPPCSQDVESTVRLMRAMRAEMIADRAVMMGHRVATKIEATMNPQEVWLVCGNDLYASEEEAWKAAMAIVEDQIAYWTSEEEDNDFGIWLSSVRYTNPDDLKLCVRLYNRLMPTGNMIRVDKLELKQKFEPRV